jgi:hypothetical protein
MKTLYKIALFIAVFSVWSCKKDKGNYDYTEREVISVKGIESTYNILAGLSITIDPEVSSNKEGELEYLWGIYESNLAGTYIPVMDTVSRTKKIDYVVNRVVKDWFLVLRVTNSKTGYAQYFNSTIKVGSEFTRGWYVIKTEADKSDLDLFLTPQNITPVSKRENVYSVMNGKKLDGSGMILKFFHDYKVLKDGVYSNTGTATRSLVLLSDKDASVVDISTMKEIHDLNGLFFEPPAVKRPGFIGNDLVIYYMVNNGQLHSISFNGPSSGIFGGRKLRGANDLPYNLSKYHLMILASSFFFDETSSTFFTASDHSLYLTAVTDVPGTQLSANNNNKKLLYMGTKTPGPSTGVAIFQDKTDPTLKSLATISPSQFAFRMVTETLNPTDKIYNGSNFALLYQDENLIYFSVGNEIWSRNLSNKFEQLQFTVPSNETVTFIRHRKYTGAGVEAPYSYNYVMIGTKSGDSYKIRMFTKTVGNLAATPAFILEGKGSPADAMYVSPSIVTNSYPSTY